MSFNLIIVRAFDNFGVGAVITEPADIHQILTGEHARDAMRVAAPQSITSEQKGG